MSSASATSRHIVADLDNSLGFYRDVLGSR